MPAGKKNIVFFIHAFNDIDHLTPLIWRFAQEKEYVPIVYSSKPQFKYKGNHNVLFLAKQCGVVVRDLDREFIKGSLVAPFLFVLIDIVKAIENWSMPQIAKRIRVSILKRSSKMLLRMLEATKGWRERFFSDVKPCRLIFDWGSQRNFPHTPLIHEARRRSIPTYLLPHGIFVYTHPDTTVTVTLDKKRDPVYDGDYVVTQGFGIQEPLEFRGCLPERMVALGSMRFSREWMHMYRKHIVKDVLSEGDDRKLKIVFFLSKLHYHVYVDALRETIAMLANRNDISLIIKPHTRGMGVGFMEDIVKKKSLSVHYDTSSVVLSDWSDVALVYGSSIGLQSLYDDKVLVYPSYIDSNSTNYEKTGAAWCVESVVDLSNAIDSLVQDHTCKPYGQHEVDEMFKECVYSVSFDRNIIEDYYKFILDPEHSYFNTFRVQL